MQSGELLKLIQDFPHGSETLVLRIIHILTENSKPIFCCIFLLVLFEIIYLILAFPTVELVNKVRELHEKKSQDVRFLIPVLVGLSKVVIGFSVKLQNRQWFILNNPFI